jgi:hypothetical protein
MHRNDQEGRLLSPLLKGQTTESIVVETTFISTNTFSIKQETGDAGYGSYLIFRNQANQDSGLVQRRKKARWFSGFKHFNNQSMDIRNVLRFLLLLSKPIFFRIRSRWDSMVLLESPINSAISLDVIPIRTSLAICSSDLVNL